MLNFLTLYKTKKENENNNQILVELKNKKKEI